MLDYRTKLNDYFDFEYFNKIEVKNRPLFFAVLLLMKDKIKQFLDEEEHIKIYKNNVYLKDEFDNLPQDKIEPEKVISFDESNSDDKIKYFNKFLYDAFSTKIKENQNNKYKEQVIENIIGLCYIEFFKYSTQQLGGGI